ncbi:unannotated protein [freshwater metagenome]|uniref:Unannotated protein n=1 Tax=freshwater metagenome TaxID=449393 RepID=A0A6J7F522_9ZZZZ
MADPAQIAHLLRRTEYVARPDRVTALSLGTLSAAVDDVLNFAVTPVALPAFIDHSIDGQGWEQYVVAAKWWLDRMVDSPKPLQEKMAFFWHGHFTSSWWKVGDTWAMTKQNKLYRDNAVGSFYTLTQAMAVEPAMLLYLDNAQNTKGSPNENFARELMELFTLGVGNYTESDVEAAARAWTGYGINWTTYAYEYHLASHDTSNKTFFGTTKAWTGPQIIDEILLNNAAKALTTARRIVTKLWEYFAHQNPPTAVVDALAPAFAADWQVKPLLKAIFLRSEFYLPAATQGLVRSPIDWVVALMYHTGFRSDAINPQWYVEGMGQVPFDPPNVAGWKSNASWVNTSTFGARAEFARGVTWHLRQNDGFANLADMTIADAVDSVTAFFGIAPVSTVTRTAMTNFLTAQRAAAPWGDWWEPTNLLSMAMLAPEMHVA